MSASENATDIIIPVHNRYPYTRNLLEGIYRYTDVPFHIYVIDNDSTDETVDLDKIFTRDITIIRNRRNRGWCGGINQGIQEGKNPNLVFMRNEVEVSNGWLGNMLAFLNTHPRIGAVSPLNSGPNNWQGIEKVRKNLAPQIPNFLTEDLHERNRILKYHFPRAGILVEGMLEFFCIVLKRRTANTVGLLESHRTNGGEADAYCRRLRKAGYVLGLSLDTYILHHSTETVQTIFPNRTTDYTDSTNLK